MINLQLGIQKIDYILISHYWGLGLFDPEPIHRSGIKIYILF